MRSRVGLLSVNNTFAEPNPERDGHIIVAADSENVLVQNNVFHEPRAAAVRVSTDCATISGLVMDHNLTTAATMISGDPCDTVLADNLLSSDAQLVDPAGNSERAGSSARDQGETSIDSGISASLVATIAT